MRTRTDESVPWSEEPSEDDCEARTALREDTEMDAIDYARRVGVWMQRAALGRRKKAALYRALVTARDLVGLLEELNGDA